MGNEHYSKKRRYIGPLTGALCSFWLIIYHFDGLLSMGNDEATNNFRSLIAFGLSLLMLVIFARRILKIAQDNRRAGVSR